MSKNVKYPNGCKNLTWDSSSIDTKSQKLCKQQKHLGVDIYLRRAMYWLLRDAERIQEARESASIIEHSLWDASNRTWLPKSYVKGLRVDRLRCDPSVVSVGGAPGKWLDGSRLPRQSPMLQSCDILRRQMKNALLLPSLPYHGLSTTFQVYPVRAKTNQDKLCPL